MGSQLVKVLMLAVMIGEVLSASIKRTVSPGSGGSVIVSGSGNLLSKSALASCFPQPMLNVVVICRQYQSPPLYSGRGHCRNCPGFIEQVL